MARLYRIWQEENNDYDTFDSAVVVANSDDEARQIHPGASKHYTNEKRWEQEKGHGTWAKRPELVQVEQIGIALDTFKPGQVIVSSFNAG